jgi:hypothetical protein
MISVRQPERPFVNAMRTGAIVGGLLIACAAVGEAQSFKCVFSSTPYFEYQVPIPVRFLQPDTAHVRPGRDPEAMARAGTDTFVVQFLVDTAGIAVPGTFQVLRGGSRADRAVVQTALPTWRFASGRFGQDCKVIQLVQVPIEKQR